LGIHIYKESEGGDKREINLLTYGNFIVRFLLVLTFVAIVALLPANTALVFASAWGLILLTILSYSIAKAKKANLPVEIIWHLAVAILVIIGSRVLGNLISNHII
jgi:VIT1/CCC1 family predicted Fe2+/Mn2+ transporter